MDSQRFFEIIYFIVTLDKNYIDVQTDYIDIIFPQVFLWTIIISLLTCSLFYNLINNLTGRLGYAKWWYVFMILNAVICAFLAFDIVASVIYPDVSIQSDAYSFAFNNLALSCLLFFIFSMILKIKKITIYASHIPFITPW